MVGSDQGITLAVLLVLIGFFFVPFLLDLSARLTGIIFLIFGILILLSIYDPSALTMILSHVNAQNSEFIFAIIQQEGALTFGSFLVGSGLGLLLFYPALRRRKQ